ncbi:hypothetical protein H632_c5355p0, partial [Helicosporidium sp. ATCC 50920]
EPGPAGLSRDLQSAGDARPSGRRRGRALDGRGRHLSGAPGGVGRGSHQAARHHERAGPGARGGHAGGRRHDARGVRRGAQASDHGRDPRGHAARAPVRRDL